MRTSHRHIGAAGLWLAIIVAAASSGGAAEPAGGDVEDGVLRIRLLPPGGPENPRNSEGDFVRLNDGRLLFVYTHFTGGAGDHASAHLAGRFSGDGGNSWTGEDVVIVPNEAGRNVMSVSLVRLKDGRIGLFYLRKESLSDCRPVMRTSRDEGKTWSEPAGIVPDSEIGYYVLNNDRAVQLGSGRIVVPLAQHHGRGWDKWTPHARIVCYSSDDGGRTWMRGAEAPTPDRRDEMPVMLQEPGVVELNEGRLMMFCRTDAGSQYVATSGDGGESWSKPEPSEIVSPLSPASIERIPSTEDLLLVWNDHRDVARELRGKRTPLRIAVSRDEGRTWGPAVTLEDNPHGWFCYTAVEFVDDHVLLAYCAGDRRRNNGLAETQITRFPVTSLYGTARDDAEAGFVPLFDGKSLKGWTVEADKEAAAELWSVRDGVLAAKPGTGWLRTDEMYGDFVLRLEWRVPENGNSGVFVRVPVLKEGQRPWEEGIEIQVLDDEGPQYAGKLKPYQYSGSIYGAVPAAGSKFKGAGRWNRFEITCREGHIEVVFNGKQAAEVDISNLAALKDRPRKGHIGLQNHGSRVEYRNIRIKVLEPGLPNAPGEPDGV